MQKKKGISLIVLVITIIVMIILAAAVIISLSSSGIINKANGAQDATEIGNEKHIIEIASATAIANNEQAKLTVSRLEEALKETSEGEGITVLDNGDTVVIKFNKTDRYYEVDAKGKLLGQIEVKLDNTPGVLDGTGTEAEPFVIMSIEDLMYFAKNVTTFKNKYVALGVTLDFQSNLSYVDVNTIEYDAYLGGDGTTGLKEQLTKGLGFMPINNFIGTFDGNNNYLKNIYINKESINNVGLFNYSTNLTIQNLNISGKITGNTYVGSLLGEPSNSKSKVNIINCNNYADVKGNACVGGIVGYGLSTYIENCNNYGEVQGSATSDTRVGGIVGATGKVINCTNYGHVLGSTYVGGISGAPNSNYIFGCVNKGNIEGTTCIGGICGISGNGVIIEKSYNSGTVSGTTNIGGICGVLNRSSVIRCAYNVGKVIGNNCVGGVIGKGDYMYTDNPGSFNLYNVGKVMGNKNVGEAIGYFDMATSQYYGKIYYLTSRSNQGLGNVADIDGMLEGKDETYLKSKEFVDLLNSAHTHKVNEEDVDYTNNCWKMDSTAENDGYPIFK